MSPEDAEEGSTLLHTPSKFISKVRRKSYASHRYNPTYGLGSEAFFVLRSSVSQVRCDTKAVGCKPEDNQQDATGGSR